MPLKLNVGLSRKVGEPNYSSRGAAVNMELELDGGLAAEPDKLHDKIRRMFTLVRDSLEEELRPPAGAAGNGKAQANGNGHANGNGNGNGNGERPAGRLATQSQ